QGVVPLRQFERPPRLGSIMDFVVERIDEAEGLVILSREGAVTRTTWDHLQKGAIVEARVTATNKGGLELEMVGNIRAFMPASQVDLHHVDSLEKYIGEKLHAMVQEIDRKARKVLISRRMFLEQERAQKRVKVWAEIEVGQVREGVISSVVEYGAFVDIGGVDGLIHISDMSYKHIGKPAEAVKVGEKVNVKVLKLDKEKQRISLGLKQVAPDPWEGLETRLTAGEAITGRVIRVADFGAFVEVETGVEGLLPASEITWKRAVKVSDVVKEGDMLRLVVLQVDPAKRRISLSLKQSQGDPWVGAEHKYAKHSLADATILSATDFGAFAELEPGVEGLVHISELSDKRVNAVTDVVKVGEKHQFRILEVDEDNRRIRLSIKAVKEAPPAEPAPKAAALGKPAAAKPSAAAARKKAGNLKGGMDLNRGMGGISLSDFKL
ncbi:MAG: S1 RNA-binding domain-containing protein, partial [Planctomycetota bacterium]|nr:S1 RNA-binding domain-containing protein [Planctomycetota bacterium]